MDDSTTHESGAALAETLLPESQKLAANPFQTAVINPTQTGRITILPRLDPDAAFPQLRTDPKPRYEASELLGQGGVGTVMLARDNDIERDVAVKRLLPEHNSSGAVRRFIDEIRTVGQLEHPGIVPVYDVGQDDDGSYFFVMKRLQGETLSDVIQRLQDGDPRTHEQYPFEARFRLWMSAVEAVGYAHSRGFIHRDLKPSNIMIGQHGEVVVIDWGLAKRTTEEVAQPEPDKEPAPDLNAMRDTLPGLDTIIPANDALAQELARKTQLGEITGTPLYMAPEQALGHIHKMDQRTDIYALGVVLYELLSLHHYLEDRMTGLGPLYGAITENPAPVYSHNHPIQGRVPVEYGHFIERCMAKEPTQRFQSMHELLVEANRILSGQFPIRCLATGYKRTLLGGIKLHNRHPTMVHVGTVMLLLAMMTVVVMATLYITSA